MTESEAAFRWIDDQSELQELVAELVSHPAIGWDTEFHRERSYYPHLALVQVAWPNGIALIDPLALDLTPLATVLERTVSVLHADQDIAILERSCGAAPAVLFDTQVAAGFLGMSSPSLAALVERFAGVRLAKGHRLADWAHRPLSEGECRYAANDVAHLLHLHERLTTKLEEKGRLTWALAECETLLARDRSYQDPDRAWWRMKDSRALRGDSRNIAQTVAAWRERRAERLDIPPRFVLSDMALANIAQRKPTRPADLDGIRGLDRRQIGGAADELLAAVREGLSLEPEALRLPVTDEGERGQRAGVTLASAWVAQLGRDLGIDPALLATRSDVVGFLRGSPSTRLANGWRAELVGEPVRKLVSGEAALAFDGENLVLEDRAPARADRSDGGAGRVGR
ncbi:MAG: ribonuclease D [Actinobacteria bacterium]|nr:ribonuclease D [Actinomycetota bacterium]